MPFWHAQGARPGTFACGAAAAQPDEAAHRTGAHVDCPRCWRSRRYVARVLRHYRRLRRHARTTAWRAALDAQQRAARRRVARRAGDAA